MVTQKVFDNAMNEKLDQINSSVGLNAQFDEQYSRSQRCVPSHILFLLTIRFTYGAAPFATCTVMDENGEIINLSHVDKVLLEASTLLTKSGTKVKSKGKLAHHMAFLYMRDNLSVCLYLFLPFYSYYVGSTSESHMRSVR